MKHKVSLSGYSTTVSFITLLILLGILAFNSRNGNFVGVLIPGCAVILLLVPALVYMPLAVSVSDKTLTVHRPLMRKNIPLSEIESIETVQPTMGEKRVCGSGGFFGYWGWFSEKDLGRYFAYYGKSSDCFLVKLKNGKRYMLGCDDPRPVVGYVAKRLK